MWEKKYLEPEEVEPNNGFRRIPKMILDSIHDIQKFVFPRYGEKYNIINFLEKEYRKNFENNYREK